MSRCQGLTDWTLAHITFLVQTLFLPLEDDSSYRHFSVVVVGGAVEDAVWMVHVPSLAQVVMVILADVVLKRQRFSGHCRHRPISDQKCKCF